MLSADVDKATASLLPHVGAVSSRSFEVMLGGRPAVTLQSMVLALQGVCTEPGTFYRLDGKSWVSESPGTLFLGPGATLATDTFGNMLGIGSWRRSCQLDGLFLALLGRGLVEVRVYQAKTGHARERLGCEVCQLSPNAETVLDLSHYALNGPAGGIWFEVTNCSTDEVATVSGARYLTCGSVATTLRLALCLTDRATTTEQDGLVAARLAQWCNGTGKVVKAEVLLAAAETSALDQLQAARDKGFSHAVLMDPGLVIAPETLDRVLTCLALARSPALALGAAVLDPADRRFMAANGSVAGNNAKPTPRFRGLDLHNADQIVAMECELAEAAGENLRFQPEFIGLCLTNLTPVTDPNADFDTALRDRGLQLSHMTGVLVRNDLGLRQSVGPTVTLQNVIYPEAGLCTEGHMYFHAAGPAGYDADVKALNIEQGTLVKFDSYFNALNIGKWHATCQPEGLYLGLRGRGRVLVRVFHAIPDKSWELLCEAPFTLSVAIETMIDLSHYTKTAVTGMIYFELLAVSTGVQLTAARFAAPGAINRSVRLCLSITTFRREAQVENTARRIAEFFATSDFARQMHLNIVDNGDSACIIDNPKITRIPNANLGGAGGFSRGLIEAETAGFTHVLFMDDDAAIPMEALHRTYAFLSLSHDPKATVSGAMISNADKWRMWENGAIFDRNCRPQFNGVDLRDWTQVMNMEFTSASYRSPQMYGGWWFFAFPVAQVTHYPFPFFVRGDDINFSLANDFNITTLNGIVSFAEDFSDKESPLTLYLDLRNHFVQHLTLPKMEIGAWSLARIGIGFFRRNVAKFQYETVAALLMAWNDVLKGPEFFASNADAASQRAAVKALYKVEAWKPVATLNLTQRRRYATSSSAKRLLFRWSLNGHLLPFFRLWGNRVVLEPRDRNNYAAARGAACITYLNHNREMGYTVTPSKTRFISLSFQLSWLILRTYFGYAKLLASYRQGYADIAAPGFWRRALKLRGKPVAVGAEAEVV